MNDQIDAAIDAAEAKGEEVAESPITTVQLQLRNQAFVMEMTQAMTINAPPAMTDPPVLLVRETDGTWFPVLLPDGSRWVLTAHPQQPTPPRLWTPGMPQ